MSSEILLAVNKRIRTAATAAMRSFTSPGHRAPVNLRSEKVDKILLVRPNFRLGNSILALPSIQLFRNNYPGARIDFVGSPVSDALFANLPVHRHYRVARRFPKSSWDYPVLLRKLRREKYDLAIEVSCSQSALGAFVVGLSGARVKVGNKGKWDFGYDVKVPRPSERNKYRVLPAFVAAMGLESADVLPRIVLSEIEIAAGREALRAVGVDGQAPLVGVFVGARKRHGKRWPASDFVRLIRDLAGRSLQVAVFLGPEEEEMMAYFKENSGPNIPVLFEPSIRRFAAMVAHCRIFVTCDSGPMHLACAVGVRTIALFQNQDFNRWGPPAESAKILYDPNGVSVETVGAACLAELQASATHREEENPPLDSEPLLRVS